MDIKEENKQWIFVNMLNQMVDLNPIIMKIIHCGVTFFVIGDIEILDMSNYTKKFIIETLFDKYKDYYFVRAHMGDDYTHITYFEEEANK